jgi:hypothetical protein
MRSAAIGEDWKTEEGTTMMGQSSSLWRSLTRKDIVGITLDASQVEQVSVQAKMERNNDGDTDKIRCR